MANQTVYPYGTGGSLPSSVGIINDCTTGGADKALAAQQGVVLKEELDRVNTAVYGGDVTSLEVEYDRSNGETWILAEADMFVYNTNRLGIWIPITPEKSYRVVCEENSMMILAVLRTRPNTSTTTDKTPDYATGCSRTVVQGGDTYSFTAPSNARYIYLTLKIATELHPHLYEQYDEPVTQVGLIEQVSSLENSTNDLKEELSAPVLSYVGNDDTYAIGKSTNGILLKGHSYRFYLIGYDFTDVSVASTNTVGLMLGTGEDNTTVQIFRIVRGTGTFVAPQYIEYTAPQNIYNLRFDGRNKSGEIVKLVIDDLGETEFTPTLSIDGADNNYVFGGVKTKLYKGIYRLNILHWEVSTDTPNTASVIVLSGTNNNDEAVTFAIYKKDQLSKNPRFIDFTVSEDLHDVVMSGRAKSGTKGIAFIEQKPLVSLDTLNFPVLGCGNKMLSLPSSTYVHLPKVIETSSYIFVMYLSSKENTIEEVSDKNDTVLCVISKVTGEQWYETIFDCKQPEVVDENTCLYNHNSNMINVSDSSVVITVGCVNNNKFLFVNKTYDAATRTIGAVEKTTIFYSGNSHDLYLRNYIQMANSLYSLSITETDKVANSEDIWNPSIYIDNGVTKYIALFSFNTAGGNSPTPYIMMTSTDAKQWSPLFLLENDLKPGETSAIVVNSKIYLTNRIGTSAVNDVAHGQFFGVCDMSGNMLKAWEKINVQRTKPCEVEIGGVVYVIYNDGNNTGKYWGRTKIIIAKVNADYSFTEIKSYTSPYGVHYPSACNHNGAMLIVWAEDVRGINAGINNAINNIAVAQFYDFG